MARVSLKQVDMSKIAVKDVKGNDIIFVKYDGFLYHGGVLDLLTCGLDQQHENVKNMDVRDDDVIVVAFPKSGMHWLWEIVTMIQNKTTEYSKEHKESAMLDSVAIEKIDSLPSPRVLNMHFPLRWLPKQLLEKQRPIIHIMRNPKDVFVSYYNHYNTIPFYQHVDSFSTFLPMMTGENGIYLRVPWFQYELEWEKFTKENPDYPILNLYYEDLKKDLEKSVSQIARFLQKDIDNATIKAIAGKCDIKGLRQANEQKTEIFLKGLEVDGVPVMYRKGIVGDWKNWFTVAENEKMNKWLEEHLVDTDLKFQYS